MYEINEMPKQIDQDVLDLLAQCRTESIGHHRHWGFAHGSIKPVMPERRVVGTAVTVAVPGHDSGMISHLFSMMRPGDFICIDRLGDNHNSCWGGGTTLAAKVGGAVGVVIDGPSTGSSKWQEYDLPGWISGYSPITCHPYGMGGAINVPICVGGAAVLPGYAVLADESGVIFLPPDDARYLAEMALQRQSVQGPNLDRIRAGAKQGDMIGITDKILKGVADERSRKAASKG
ncbi:RraA family protein [Microvirga antarctica]|uniref:RraA family protein n=1 Tax=Microvirga antarctica TaxID=2819233 RepID=UPI001B30CB8E|nr:RraA family protein [Microvirga antarctica]